MLKSRSGSSSSTADNIFNGVRFVLFGFDSVSEDEYRSELVSRGGVDVGRYEASCSHVIVSGRVYDDPACVAARHDGKILVTELWVDDSVDFGTIADASRVLYRPTKDLNGIPGSESLFICLTGYQRQERDDIMKMILLMGAHLSKPLIASRVTHLICYKFEGEKYELAKRVKIKLVNHRWLEDCLKAWEILPIDNYTVSGYDLELLEAEARDSEEETEDLGTKLLRNTAPLHNSGLQGDKPPPTYSSTPLRGASRIHTEGMELSHTAEFHQTNQRFSTPHQEICLGEAVNKQNVDTNVDVDNQEDGGFAHTCAGYQDKEADIVDISYLHRKGGTSSSDVPTTKMASVSVGLDMRNIALNFSGETSKNEFRKEESSELYRGNLKENVSDVDVDIPPVEAKTDCKPDCLQNSTISSALLQKRKVSNFSLGSKISPQSPSTDILSALMEPTSATSINNKNTNVSSPFGGGSTSNAEQNQQGALSKFKSMTYKKRSRKSSQPVSEVKSSKNADSPSFGSGQNAQQRLSLDHSMGVTKSLPDFEGQTSVSTASPDGNVLQVNPHAEQEEAANVEKSQRRTTNISEKLAVTVKSKDVSPPEEKACESFAHLEEPSLAPKSKDNGAMVIADAPNVTALPWSIHKDRGATSSDTMDSDTRNLSSIASTSSCKENADKKASAVRFKKVAPTRKLSCKPKPPKEKTDNDKGAATEDKTATCIKDETKSRKKGKPKVENFEKATVKERKEIVDLVSNIIAGEDKVKSSKHPVSKNIVERVQMTIDPEKENKPKENDIIPSKENPHPKDKVLCEERGNGRLKAERTGKSKSSEEQMNGCATAVRPELAWFILSGHRLQRKDFQTVIKRLRGRVCRDSHNWSYQATHFIVPDPIRRTEKFFAAAAAGRWILRSDYLTASSEAGKLLAEQPFEWHKACLTEDGAINLEAPRKWRHLRERTGHGAFHGMRIIIYGECIAPSLDTLKRVVKAGGGTILATAPSYARFLKSDVDFAVISPSIPRVDAYVQEFLSHEIPCIVADYLVEYVCKPGYSLERHVLYNTQAWAERSFANMQRKSQEIITDDSVTSETSAPGISCSICGLRDRADEVIICVGCGNGMHIDCPSPPLEAVARAEWFCVKCANGNEPKRPIKRSRKSSMKCN